MTLSPSSPATPAQSATGVKSKPLAAVTIGNFDGAHLGHQQLWYKALSRPGGAAEEPTMLTFDPHPRVFLGKKPPGSFLFSQEQKLRAAKEFGLATAKVLPFDSELMATSHHDFYRKILIDAMHASSIIVGEDFCFGAGRLGSIRYLREMAQSDDQPQPYIVPPKFYRGQVISSSRLRQGIEAGEDFGAITAMLGRPYLIEGKVAEGKKLGRTIDIPTINFTDVQQLVPAPGVYYGYLWRPGSGAEEPSVMTLASDRYPALVNIGVNPTLDAPGGPLKVEAHALYPRWQDVLYGKKVGFYFLGKLRDERKFDSLADLKAQIGRDIAWAKAHFTH